MDPVTLGMAKGYADKYKLSITEAPLTPMRFGAAGNGTTNDDAAFAALWAALQGTVGGHIYLPPNKNFLLTQPLALRAGMHIEGADRRRSLITNKVSNVFVGGASMSDLNLHDFGVIAGLTGNTSGGNILEFSGAAYAGPYCSVFRNLYLQQNRYDKAILYVPDGQYLDNTFRECQTVANNRTVPAFFLRSSTGSLGDNLFSDIRHTDSGTPTTWVMWFEEDSTTTAIGNTVQRVNFERPIGGCINFRGQNGMRVRDVWAWDISTPATNHLFYLDKIAGQQINVGIVFEGIARPSGTLGSGICDIAAGSSGFALGVTVRRCITNGSQALKIDLLYSPSQNIEDCYGSGIQLQSWAPTTTIGAAAGTGAAVNSKAGNFYEGNVTINSGTSPSAGDILTVSWPNGVRATPAAVLLTPMTPAAVDAGLYVSAMSTSGFTVTSRNALPASTSGIKFAWAARRATNG